MPLFSFSIDTFQITDTRSVHTDTNYAGLTVLIGDTLEGTVFNTSPYGNLNNGTYKGNVACVGLSIPPDSSVTFNYLIVNAGFTNSNSADAVLAEVGSALTRGPAMPPLASCLQQVATQYATVFNEICKPGCDGLVAAEQDTFSYADLLSRTSGRPASFKQATTHIGPRIAHSCNSNPSHYIVNWSMAQVVEVPDLVDYTVANAEAQLRSLQLAFGTPVGSKGNYVKGQSPGAGAYVPLGTVVTLTTSVTPP